ncbi:MAG TPA: lysylphosphatidylglycerol synthase transmembrane domain-containing protein [Bacteroidales bacterium]|nr:lysylphosphatidylglycerol synthase transmembrane domain-containing protein [Bacteroidales bacterium]HRW97323.1 lysylphosphatidylglycerol synthase transmembrane domain-containing protein [Bacteroidales bacterium]
MTNKHTKIFNIFKFKRVIIPVIIGLGVITYLVFKDFDPKPFYNIRWSCYSALWIFMSLLMVATRDLAYMYRIRLLTDKQLTWRHSFDVIMLWEFASSVTPSVIGGSAAAFYIVTKEGIRPGRATAIVMITALLDELFYIVMVPLVIILASAGQVFKSDSSYLFVNTKLGMQGIFIVGYLFILLLTIIISYGVFIRPRGFKWVLLRIFKLPFLRKWRFQAAQAGNDIITTSLEMKHKPIIFWIRACFATFLSWTARFWVVNFLILSITPVSQHFLIYARQLVMWVIMLISPTPGSSGVAEFLFSDFLGDFIPLGLTAAVALLWRLFSYYPYIIIGAIILPTWIKRVFHLT